MSICTNEILNIIGEFSGLKMKDDRRFKKPTTGTIRIRGLELRLNHWEGIYKKVPLQAVAEHNDIGYPVNLKEKHAWERKYLELVDYVPFAQQFSSPFYIASPDDLTTIALRISTYNFFGDRYFCTSI